jgi:flagellar basal-body rod protein FlgB
MLDRINESFDFQSRALSLRAERQKVIAGNIANADTPRYQAQDFDFAAALRAATGAASAPGPVMPARTHAAHIATRDALAAMGAQLQYRNPPQAAIDNNTVDMDLERAQFADNSVRYEATLRFLNGQFRTINQAITGQGS